MCKEFDVWHVKHTELMMLLGVVLGRSESTEMENEYNASSILFHQTIASVRGMICYGMMTG